MNDWQMRHVPPEARAIAEVAPGAWYYDAAGQIVCPNWLSTPCQNSLADYRPPRPPKPPKRKRHKRGKRHGRRSR